MDTAHSQNLEKLITLKEAAERLNVSIETLLSWNQHNILKPTITQEGEIGYTQDQFNQFLTIRQAMHHITSPLASSPVVQPVIHEIAAPVVPLVAEVHQSSRVHGSKRSYSKSVLSFSVIVFILTIALLPKPEGVQPYQYQQTYQKLVEGTEKVLAAQTSSLNISEQIIASLPIKLKAEETSDKNLHNENNDSVFKEKTTAPVLYNQQTVSDEKSASQSVAIAKQKPEYLAQGDVNLDEIGVEDYTSTGFFQTEEDETSAIDEQGKIRGNADTKTLASVVGGIDQMVKNGSLKQGSTDATNQLLFITLGAVAVLFALQKQFAFVNPTRKTLTPQDYTHLSTASALPQKALEIDQKTDGTVVLLVLGKEHKISKPEMNSESDQFIEKLMSLAEDVKEIEYETGRFDGLKISTPLSRLVTRLGFVGIKRDLFFPRTSKNSVIFRRYLTHQDLVDMNLTMDRILNELDLLS